MPLVAGHPYRLVPPGQTTGAAVGGLVPGSSNFAYTGADQTFVVPSGATTLQVLMSGAGGGRGTQGVSTGGNAGLVGGTLSVTAGETLTIVVGQGGSVGDGGSRYGGGGQGGTGYPYGGSGGGRSAIRRAGADIVTAGGGGGGGYYVGGGSGGGTYGGNAGGSSGQLAHDLHLSP